MLGPLAREGRKLIRPCTNKSSENQPRDRVLSDAELVQLWNALPSSDYGAIVRLLILTGCRREEIGALAWSEINLEAKTVIIPGSRTKNHTQHLVPLSDLALDILKARHRIIGRDFVFGRSDSGFLGFTFSKKLLDKAVPLEEPWVLHDLRRTCATRMADIGIQPHIIEAVLNHVSGHKAGVAGIYNRSSYAKEKADALQRWAGHIKVILAQAEGANVIEMARAK